MSTKALVKKARKYQTERATARPSLQRAVAAAVRKTVEKKGVDTPLNSTPIVSTMNGNENTVCVNLIQQGAGSWNRVGRKIQLQSLRVRGELEWTLDSAVSSGDYKGNVVRMTVVWDKSPQDTTTPSAEQVFGVTGQDGSETATYLNPVRYDNMDRFSVLRDCVIKFEPPMYNAAAGSTNIVLVRQPFDEFIKLNGKETTYSGNTNPVTSASLTTGGLYVIFRAAENTAATNFVGVSSNSFARLRYVDP